MQIRNWASAMLLLLVAACGGCSGQSDSLAKAKTAVSQADYGTAVIMLRNLVSKNTGNADAQLLLSRVLMLRGELTDARRAADAAAAAGGSVQEVAVLRADLAIREGGHEQLLASIESGTSGLDARMREIYRGQALLAAGDPVAALAAFDGLLRNDHSSADLNTWAARCHALLGRANAARTHVDMALQTDSGNAHAWMLKAELLARGLDREGYLEALKQAFAHAGGRLDVREQLLLSTYEVGVVLRSGDAQAARIAHGRLLRLAPQAPFTDWVASQVSLLDGDAPEAAAKLQHLLQSAPDFQPARPALIAALMLTGRLEQAVQQTGTLVSSAPGAVQPAMAQAALRRAVALPAGSADRSIALATAAVSLDQRWAAGRILEDARAAQQSSLLVEVAQLQLQLESGRVAEVRARSEALLKDSPVHPEVLALVGAARFEDRDFAGAADAYRRLAAIKPSAQLALQRARALFQAGEAQPQQPLQQWLEGHPGDAVVRLVLAEMAAQRGQRELAVAQYEALIASHPRNAVALNNLAWLYHQMGRPGSLELAQRAYQEAQSNAQIADTYGWLLAQSGALERALPILRAAAKVAPSQPLIRFHLGSALARSEDAGDRERARLLLADLLREEATFEGRTEVERILATLS